jgi:hypothetical protein
MGHFPRSRQLVRADGPAVGERERPDESAERCLFGAGIKRRLGPGRKECLARGRPDRFEGETANGMRSALAGGPLTLLLIEYYDGEVSHDIRLI